MLSLSCDDLIPGAGATEQLIDFCGFRVLSTHAREMALTAGGRRSFRPFNIAGGQAILNARLPLNSFAAELSPVPLRYFSSLNDQNITEIAERAYISSAETTQYDAILKSLLKDRVQVRRDTIVEPLQTGLDRIISFSLKFYFGFRLTGNKKA